MTRQLRASLVSVLAAAATLASLAAGLSATGPGAQSRGQAPKPTLYIVSNSHLDTQWNWTVQDTIRDLIPATFGDNFALFERFPNYVFNFESAIHYMWFKEYHPGEWPTVQKYVESGRWRLAGGWIVAADTHVPSPEALMRQALYGKRFFRQEFGRTPVDIYLPDCFGFGFALPSIAARSGFRAFSTQKLSWGAPAPPPFAVGRWKGVDGSTLVAALRAGDYVSRLRSDVSTDPKWTGDLAEVGSGRKVGFRYFGVGDVGGAPDAESVEWLEKAMANTTGAVSVRNTSADQLARDLTDAERAALAEYEGELPLMTHGVGCFTSQAALKAWNRRNELLADAAERASVAAEWLGGPAYPGERIRQAWTRFLWHQFHDDLTGTSIPQAYLFSWNDELLSLNEFAGITTAAAASIASGLDTTASGVPLVVYNPLAMTRRDPVEALVRFGGAPPVAVTVVDTTTGQNVPAQVIGREGGQPRILFVADMPPVGFKVFDVRPAPAGAATTAGTLKVTASTLENERYAVKLDDGGDLVSVVDRETGRELLGGPARLELLDNVSTAWPAWEILWKEASRPPRAYATTPRVRIAETGPARVALEVTRTAEGSTFVQQISLAAGGDRLDVETSVDWRTPGTLLKASFPLASSNSTATYDLGLGVIERGNASEKQYEVPGQQWADLTDAGGSFGAAILNDGKYGWDKPADHTLRLTLLHTPKPGKGFVYQSSNDLGRHRFTYAVAGHAGDWRAGRVPARAARLNQPLMAFQTAPHGGPIGRAFSMIGLSGDSGQVAVRALKKAEDGEDLVVRVQELYGRPAAGVGLTFPVAVLAAREINAAEEPVGPVPLSGGRLVIDLSRYESRSFSLRLGSAGPRVIRPEAAPLALPFNADGVSSDADRGDGDFDGKGRTFPAELLPSRLELGGIPFTFGATGPGAKNVLVAAGQTIPLPAGRFDRVFLIATAVGGDVRARFAIERPGASSQSAVVRVQEWEGAIGQWDSRLADDRLLREVYVPPVKDQSWPLAAIDAQMVVKTGEGGVPLGVDRLRPGFVKRDEVALVAAHRHSRQGNEPYVPAYLFKYALDLPEGASAIVLPADSRIRVLAMTVARGWSADTVAASPLYVPEITRESPPQPADPAVTRRPAPVAPGRRR